MRPLKPLSERAFDVVLWGATGFTGALVAEELVRRYGARGEVRWAIGGRSRPKLEDLKRRLSAIDPAARDLQVFVADAHDAAAIEPMVRETRVVATTVGPYALYGHELATACAEEGTSYCDLTGEPHFVRASIDRNHERARATGARIVHACGFDSIPSDLGAYMVQAHAQSLGTRCKRIKMLVGGTKGTASGGTVATMLNIAEGLRTDPNLRRVLGNPYALDPDPGHVGPDGRDQTSVRFDEETQRWTAPFFMAGMNTRVVRRTNALFGYGWGEDFRYSEATSFARGPGGFASAASTLAGLGFFFGALSIGPLRKLLADHVLPAPGEGPSAEKRAAGYFTFRHFAELEGAEGKRIVGVVKDTFDPGYGSTARMFSETAVCLAKDDLVSEPGVLTPAYAMRERFLDRARRIGMTFQVE